jgi:hypothetical protein
MRNLLAFMAAALLAFAGAGWYLGWYQVQSTPAASGKSAVKIEIDRNKIGTDLEKGKEKLHDALEKPSSSSDAAKGTSTTSDDSVKPIPD